MLIIKRKEAIQQGLVKYYTGKACKHGHKAERFISSFACIECVKFRQASSHYRDINLSIRTKNKDSKKIYDKSYRANHTQEQKINKLAHVIKRRVSKLSRTPSWVDSEELWLIKEVYSLAALRTKMFGFSWHVDHIVPLQGKLVSGLHTIANLQVIPASQNVQKSNTWSTR